jgi:hypothetical protein
MVAACYHAYGEVIRALFDAGAIRVETAPAVSERRKGGERGAQWTAEGFDALAEQIAFRNIGSQISPFYFAEACDCDVREMPGRGHKYPASPDAQKKRGAA